MLYAVAFRRTVRRPLVVVFGTEAFAASFAGFGTGIDPSHIGVTSLHPSFVWRAIAFGERRKAVAARTPSGWSTSMLSTVSSYPTSRIGILGERSVRRSTRYPSKAIVS